MTAPPIPTATLDAIPLEDADGQPIPYAPCDLEQLRAYVRPIWEQAEALRVGHGAACVSAWWAEPHAHPRDARAVLVRQQLLDDHMTEGTYYVRVAFVTREGRAVSPPEYLRAEAAAPRTAAGRGKLDAVIGLTQSLAGATAWGATQDERVRVLTKDYEKIRRERDDLERKLAKTEGERDHYKALYEAVKDDTAPIVSDDQAPEVFELINTVAQGGLSQPAEYLAMLVRQVYLFAAACLAPDPLVMRRLAPRGVPTDGFAGFLRAFNLASEKSTARSGQGTILRLGFGQPKELGAPATPPTVTAAPAGGRARANGRVRAQAGGG